MLAVEHHGHSSRVPSRGVGGVRVSLGFSCRGHRDVDERAGISDCPLPTRRARMSRPERAGSTGVGSEGFATTDSESRQRRGYTYKFIFKQHFRKK